MKIHENLAEYEGNNRNFSSMCDLINQIDAYNISNFPYSEIKLTRIKSKEDLSENKKYSVKITKRSGGCIETVDIIENVENK